MAQTYASQAEPLEREGWGYHGCCCDHVVEELQAMPAPDEERLSVVRDRYYACPHHELTPLEVLLGTLH